MITFKCDDCNGEFDISPLYPEVINGKELCCECAYQIKVKRLQK